MSDVESRYLVQGVHRDIGAFGVAIAHVVTLTLYTRRAKDSWNEQQTCNLNVATSEQLRWYGARVGQYVEVRMLCDGEQSP